MTSVAAKRGGTFLVLLALVSSACLPAVAFACPVCFAARDHANQLAFLGSTVLLTSLPVIMVGSVIVWVARRSRDLDGGARPKRQPEPEQLSREEGAASARPSVAPISRRA